MRIAVIGAGSTYTPELVAGLAPRARPARARAAGAARHRRRAARRRRRAGRAHARPRRLRRAARATGDLDRAIDGADFVLVQIRVGGQAARHQRRDDAARVRLRRARRRPAPAASPRRCAPCPWCSRSPSACAARAAGRVDRRLHEPGRHRHPRAARRTGTAPCGLCNVAIGFQRRIAARLQASRPSASPSDQVGLNHLTWIRGVEVDGEDVLDRAAGRLRRRDRRRVEHAARGCSPSSARSRPTTCSYFYCHDQVRGGAAAGTPTRGRRCRPSSASCSRCTATPRWRRSRRCSSSAAAPTTARRRRSCVASLHTGDGDGAGGRRPQRRRAAGPAPTTTSSRCRRASAPTARSRCRRRRSRPDLLGLVQHVAAYERTGGRGGARRHPVAPGARCWRTR